jgi:hypothetical protein
MMVIRKRRAAHRHGDIKGFVSVGMPGTLALLCIFGWMIAGCRENETVTGPAARNSIVLNFSAGDTFVYERWMLDEFGYRTGSVKRQESWRILQTGIIARGETGVTVVIDSLGAQRSDTLLVRSTTSGDTYEFGFLARLVNQVGGRTIVPRWDLLLRSGPGSPSAWAAGVADSIAEDTVYAQRVDAPDYFVAQLNGRSTVFPAYRVELNGASLQFVLWVTDAPSCFAGFRAESTSLGNGFEVYLDTAFVAHG